VDPATVPSNTNYDAVTPMETGKGQTVEKGSKSVPTTRTRVQMGVARRELDEESEKRLQSLLAE
jgi:hypothetical protein